MSTFNAILARHGEVTSRRTRPRWPRAAAVPLVSVRPNQIWPADFKGQFKTGDGRYCYPLTITDHFSRKLLATHGLLGITSAATRAVFLQVFREVGLPDAIRTDNGVPFVSRGLQGLSALSVWWMQLGIVHQRTRPARPQDNGSHERMHRELKRETAPWTLDGPWTEVLDSSGSLDARTDSGRPRTLDGRWTPGRTLDLGRWTRD